MLKIPGTAALSTFRLQQLLLQLQGVAAPITALNAQFIHLVNSENDLTEQDCKMLERLLQYGEAGDVLALVGEHFIVVPRAGTISPWSSKATEIVQRCGLNSVLRIERGIHYTLQTSSPLSDEQRAAIEGLLHDRMTQCVIVNLDALSLFEQHPPLPLETIAVMETGLDALERANSRLGLALSADELEYLHIRFEELARDPTDVELMMFAQANSEHCRHKIFNAAWTIDGVVQAHSLFDMIRHTSEQSPHGLLSAYHDNAAVMTGSNARVFIRNPLTGEYAYEEESAHILMKVETHNHPTAISPFPGAATGSGGEIRDEGATGRGSATKAGLTGFSVSHLKIPNFEQPWEQENGKPARIASALEIMLQGPLGGAAFNNEFGRPNLAGYFRTFEQPVVDGKAGEYRGYHKPIMIAGGMGNIRPMLVEKHAIPEGAYIVVLGGPAMLIGLGGSAASSQASGMGSEALDFASVQRDNPEMQRRCQEVINHCNALGEDTPIISIHDVGAGGLSNAVPEIIHDCQRGGNFQLRYVNIADPSLSPMQIWCNEAQERYVVAVRPEALTQFEAFCEREHCLYAVIGEVTLLEQLRLFDNLLDNTPIDLPMSVLFGRAPKMQRHVAHVKPTLKPLNSSDIVLAEAIKRVLSFPVVADKSFLIHIGDRSVTGLVVRDQMVGPWQVPVADVAVTASGFYALTGEAMAMGERAPLALINPAASGRMAIGEALTNIAAAGVEALSDVKLSANWMAAAGNAGEDAALFDTVKAVGLELCPALGIAIPVGKDSLSMKTVWQEDGLEKSMTAPLSLIVTAFAPIDNVSKTLTPQCRALEETVLILIDLGAGQNRLGGSVLAQVYQQLGDDCPDLDQINLFKGFFDALQTLNSHDYVLAYHDRSDGGLLATIAEMLFASRLGIILSLDELGGEVLPALFNEELGAVIQVKQTDLEAVQMILEDFELTDISHVVGEFNKTQTLSITLDGRVIYSAPRAELQQCWSELSYRMQAMRDNPDCARQQFERIADDNDLGLHAQLTFDPNDDMVSHLQSHRPKVAILREQGVNGHVEMAAAFDRAGFNSIDVHMSDIISGRVTLTEFKGLVACGGFSYGDVLGAGGGWAKSILFNQRAREAFAGFFQREDTFGLGVCNGCQMLSGLKELIPGSDHWPAFKRNVSEQFEARVALVKIQNSPSIFFTDMVGSVMPVVVAHGEGRAEFIHGCDGAEAALQAGVVSVQYVDNYGAITTSFPANPNGSLFGITSLTTQDGRFTIMMPHPERCFRTLQNSWHPDEWQTYGAWMRMFRNARAWVG